jgi:hypothetical protein
MSGLSKYRYILILIVLCPMPSFGQKVVIFRDLYIGQYCGFVKFEHSHSSFPEIDGELRDSMNINGDHIIFTDRDFLSMSSYGDDNYNEAHAEIEWKGYPQFVVKNLQAFPSDTIIISGLELKSYPCCLHITSYGVVNKRGQKRFRRNKSYHPRNEINNSIPDSVPLPAFQINGADPIEILTQKRDTSKVTFNAHGHRGNKQYAWHTHRDEIQFTFVVDLKEADKLRYRKTPLSVRNK